ncbi:hypothetical protein J6590_031455 [Homalodisca vitripennis]|nr:hypothetical protein J6590_031455 [Homalodisca vitripennis]
MYSTAEDRARPVPGNARTAPTRVNYPTLSTARCNCLPKTTAVYYRKMYSQQKTERGRSLNQHAQHLTPRCNCLPKTTAVYYRKMYSTAEDRARLVPGNQHAQHLTRVNSSDSV